MTEFRDRMALIRRILYLTEQRRQGKAWAREEMQVEVARFRETLRMTPEELAKGMFEHNRKKKKAEC